MYGESTSVLFGGERTGKERENRVINAGQQQKEEEPNKTNRTNKKQTNKRTNNNNKRSGKQPWLYLIDWRFCTHYFLQLKNITKPNNVKTRLVHTTDYCLCLHKKNCFLQPVQYMTLSLHKTGSIKPWIHFVPFAARFFHTPIKYTCFQTHASQKSALPTQKKNANATSLHWYTTATCKI